MQPSSQLSPLETTLGSGAVSQVDIGTLVLHAHRLIVLARPLLKTVRLCEQIRRWETPELSVLLLISANICVLIPTAYYMCVVLSTVFLVGGLGVAHRQTQCLSKVFPPTHIAMEELNRMDGPLTHSELVQYYKALLSRLDLVVQTCNRKLISFYAVLKWESIQLSVRWYMSLVIIAVSIHMLPMRWTLVTAINLFLLEGKIAQAIIERRESLLQREELKCLEGEDVLSVASIDSCGSASEFGVVPGSDTDSEMSDKEGDLSSSDLSDMEPALSDVATGAAPPVSTEDPGSMVKRVSRSSGVVGKLLEFKKKHQHAHTGNCMGCNVAFSTILKRRHVCAHCGNQFCSRCCSKKVPRAMLGATAPSAQTETVAICVFCHMYLTGKKDKDTPGVV